MVIELRGPAPPGRKRKTRWAHHKADWVEFARKCEEALSIPTPPNATVQQLASSFTAALQEAAKEHIPRGARRDAKPWALHPEVQQAVAERRSARQAVRRGDPGSRARWVEASRRARKVEERISRDQFREFVTTELNRPTSVGRVSRILKKWEGAADDDHREGEALKIGDRLIVTAEEKANAFAAQYATVSRQVRASKIDRAARQRLAGIDRRRCADCSGERTDGCSPFTEEELVRAIQLLQLKKSPGPDGITHEMIKHLGPEARCALLHLINVSWETGVVPREWRAATVVPIPKSSKDKKLLTSYRPIALTSCVSKLAERLILARLEFAAESRRLIPAEQVGFRAKRSAEDSLGRLVQNVQDGWQRPKRDKRSSQPEGSTAQKHILVAYDFSRAYDVVDHKLLRLRLLELGLPLCLVRWVWGWLRDRRVRVEVQGALSKERIFRAGLPQGSVLSPQLFLLWAAGLAETLRAPGNSPYIYADDTAVLSSGDNMEVARSRAQTAADALTSWARRNKMLVAGEKTQLLVLSQNAQDAVGCAIKVDGKTVRARDTLVLLGVELDRRLQFGAHCRRLRNRVRPRNAHLRRLAGRSWGLDEGPLRTVANGYIRGAVEHAAAAWLPAAAPSHVELLEREMRAAARTITGSPRSTPVHAVMAEARLAPVSERREVLAARLVGRALALPPDDPLRKTAEATAPERLKSVRGWRTLGRQSLTEAGVPLEVEPLLPPRIPPWTSGGDVSFQLDVGPLRLGATAEEKKVAAELHLGSLPQCATWLWTDGSVEGGVKDGGAGAVIIWPDGEEEELKTPAGRHCSSYRAEMLALASGLEQIRLHPRDEERHPIIICTDSMSSLATLRAGPAAQTSPLGVAVWRELEELSRRGSRIVAQWIPSHCGVEGNERADAVARDAAALPQRDVPADSRTICRAVARSAREKTIRSWPPGWYRSLMDGHLPQPVTGLDRSRAIDVHQLRAGHWSGARSYLHRIGRHPTVECRGCSRPGCPVARCPICREEPDRPDHLLLRCPALMWTRMRQTLTIHPEPEEVRGNAVVAALAAAARSAQSREATPR